MLEKAGVICELRDGIPYLFASRAESRKYIQSMEENIHKLERLSGKSIEELIRLFAAGYELKPPTYVSDLLSMMDLEE